MPKYAPTKPKISASQTPKGRTEEDAPLTGTDDGSGLIDIAGANDPPMPLPVMFTPLPVKFNPFGYKFYKVG